jgi:hypothetical protein
MQIVGKLLYFCVTGVAPTEGKKPLKCENNQIICLPRNVKAHGKEVAHLQQSKNIQSHLLFY